MNANLTNKSATLHKATSAPSVELPSRETLLQLRQGLLLQLRAIEAILWPKTEAKPESVVNNPESK